MAHTCNPSSRKSEARGFLIQDKLVLQRRPSLSLPHAYGTCNGGRRITNSRSVRRPYLKQTNKRGAGLRLTDSWSSIWEALSYLLAYETKQKLQRQRCHEKGVCMGQGGGGRYWEAKLPIGNILRRNARELHKKKMLQNHSVPATAAQTFSYLNRSLRKSAGKNGCF